MKCALCHEEIDERKELDGEPTYTPSGPVHADCYYEAFGTLVEQYPPGRSPRGGRGCGHG